MTTELTKAAQQALEALKLCYDVVEYPANGTSRQDKAIAALERALTQRPAAQTEREAFEAWWPTVGQTIGKVAAWEAWHARATLAPQQATPETQAIDESVRNEKPAAYLYDITVDGVVCKDWCISASDWYDTAKAGVSNIRALYHRPQQATSEPVVHKCRHCGVTTIEDEDGVTMQGLPAPERPVMFDPSADVPIPATPEPLIVKGAMAGMVDAQVRDLWPTNGTALATAQVNER